VRRGNAPGTCPRTRAVRSCRAVDRPDDTNDVDVWYWPTARVSTAELEAQQDILSDDERDRCDRFGVERDRRDYAAAHVLLRRVLSLYGEPAPATWRFSRNRHGRPSIVPEQAAARPLNFSLSHTRGLVACAVTSTRDVGIDVELIGEKAAAPELAERLFARSEVAMLRNCEPEEYATRFVELWTLKEAYIKAVGVGLGHSLDSFAFCFHGITGLRFSAPPDGMSSQWRFMLGASSSEYRLALAVRCRGSEGALRLAIHTPGGIVGTPLTPLRTSSGVAISVGP
jgi:phosphopantetheinyl transferase